MTSADKLAVRQLLAMLSQGAGSVSSWLRAIEADRQLLCSEESPSDLWTWLGNLSIGSGMQHALIQQQQLEQLSAKLLDYIDAEASETWGE